MWYVLVCVRVVGVCGREEVGEGYGGWLASLHSWWLVDR